MEINVFKKKTSRNGIVELRPIEQSLAKEFCLKKHYSHKWNTAFGKINLGIFRDGSDECLGVAVFGNLMNPQSYNNISDDLKQHEVIELNRLWVDDELKKNIETVFLSLCFKYIKRNYPEIKLVQSFADGRLGCGTIYKASNFKYYGFSKATFFEDVEDNDLIYHRALTVDTRRLSTMAIMNLMITRGNLKPFKVKSYRYIYHLDKKISKSIKLKELKYPVYEKGKTYIDNFIQPLNVLCRSYMAFMLSDNQEQMKEIHSYINNEYGKLQFEDIKELAMSASMRPFLNDESYQNKLKNGINKWLNKLNT